MRTPALIGSLLALLAVGCGGSSADVTEPTPADPVEDTGDTTADRTKPEESIVDPVPDPDGAVLATTADASVLGVWKGTERGQPQPEWIFTITENQMIVTAGSMEVYEGTYTINHEVTPNQISAKITKSNMKQYVGKASLGIFELSGDSLTLAANEPGAQNFPSDFSTGGRVRVFDLSRAP